MGVLYKREKGEINKNIYAKTKKGVKRSNKNPFQIIAYRPSKQQNRDERR